MTLGVTQMQYCGLAKKPAGRYTPKKRIKQTPPKVKPKLKSLTSNQVRKKIAKGELR